MIITDIVMASALVVLVLIFIRISWTLKEIHEAMVATEDKKIRGREETARVKAEKKAIATETNVDETEIAAVIAIASAAMRAAV